MLLPQWTGAPGPATCRERGNLPYGPTAPASGFAGPVVRKPFLHVLFLDDRVADAPVAADNDADAAVSLVVKVMWWWR